MTDASVWDKEVPVPLHLIQYIDEGVRESKAPNLTTLLVDDSVLYVTLGIYSHHHN